MLKLFRYVKTSVVTIIFIAVLLILQAYCDLSLPAYTSDIVNVGIQQGGIDSVVPKVIRKSSIDKLLLFMNEEEQESVLSHYEPINIEDMKDIDKLSIIKKYPLVTEEVLYLWDNRGEEILSSYMALPMMLTSGFENGNEMTEQFRRQLMISLQGTASVDSNVFDILSLLPDDQRSIILAPLKEQLSLIPETMIGQTAIAYIKTEYSVIGVPISNMQTNYILRVGLRMIGLAMLAMLASISVTFFSARIAAKLGKEIRGRVFKKVLSFSHTEMDHFSTASLITRSTNDIQQVQMMLVMLLRIIIYSPIIAFGGIIKVLNTNTSMTWILVLGVGAIFIIIAILYAIVMPKFKIMQKLIDRINLVTREIITGLPVIRAFSTQDYEKKRFDQANMDLTGTNIFVNRAMSFMMPIMFLIMNLITALIIWVGADNISTGEMQVGDMMAFIQYTMQIIMSFLMLTMVSIMIPRASVSAKRINEILLKDISITDPEKEDVFDASRKGIVEFRNVSFRYPSAEEDVLSDISFTARPGETTAIIGSTGSGKTTLINLIPRFYDVTQGEVLVSGANVKKVKQHTLREKLGYVPQKGVLFSGTIESNIKFGDSAKEKASMIRAAKLAQAEEFIHDKTDAYQTQIAEGGTNVSGGQKQRLSIARAIATNPDIYIFDDSFSALDYKTDSMLRKALHDEIKEATVIIVAQRISTIMSADQILVLDEGRIVGKGTHKQLLKTCDVYQQIAVSQLSKEELAYE